MRRSMISRRLLILSFTLILGMILSARVEAYGQCPYCQSTLELRAHPSDAICDTGILCLICNQHQDQCEETKYWMHDTCKNCPWRVDPAREVKPCTNGDHYTLCEHCYDNRPPRFDPRRYINSNDKTLLKTREQAQRDYYR
ncbi:hypothetical protein PGTUg99_012716 [Puccinia graminis f. sp. tritici]|uniref:RING-type domain-containing protein n=1 Tax=Puccinia graminis f. sp. tritici TaxID=56615 RepID=A0A5B0S5L3_PUCGR|nr:hypothetical protein PGTUg99_012716 [Puccinia graminis f. sp. tritici]